MKNKQCPWCWHGHIQYVCFVLHVLLSGGYPLEMNGQGICADSVCMGIYKCQKVVDGRKLEDIHE